MAPKNIPVYAASYECGRALAVAGCPIDYLDQLPRNPAKYRKKLRMREIGGYAESRALDTAPNRGTTYLLPIRLGTDLPSGVIVADWFFEPPWPDHQISWDIDPDTVLADNERPAYQRYFRSRLLEVLDDHRLLRRGQAVEGLLCGHAVQSIPAENPKRAIAESRLIVTLDSGEVYTLRIQ